MAGNRKVMRRSLVANGVSTLRELEEFTPVEIEKNMAEVKGGRIGVAETMVGLQKMTCSYKVKGATAEFLLPFGITNGQAVQVTVKESLEDEDGDIFLVQYEYTGEITKVSDGNSVMGDLKETMVEMTVRAARKTENGTVIYDVDLDAGILNLGAGDILEVHRRNAGQ
jgi:P2 family phage contractile tail tube protein